MPLNMKEVFNAQRAVVSLSNDEGLKCGRCVECRNLLYHSRTALKNTASLIFQCRNECFLVMAKEHGNDHATISPYLDTM